MASETTERYGERYADWKSWGEREFGAVDGATARYYDAELRRACVPDAAPRRALELGFGNGALLAHLAAKGWAVEGTETNQGLVARARGAGFAVHGADQLDRLDEGRFGLVAAIDVLEHVSQEALPALLAGVARVLAPGGVFLARFPNGDSPLGLANQHGDVTHLTILGSAKARFLAESAGLVVRHLGPPARVLASRDLKRSAYNLATLPPRWLIEKLTKLLFFAGADIHFFSSNLVLIAARPGVAALPTDRPG